MWWEEFEKQLTSAFVQYEKHKKWQVHLNQMKLRILLDKVNGDFLAQTKDGIRIVLTMMHMIMSYIQAFLGFRNEVNWKFPPQLGSNYECDTNVDTCYLSNNYVILKNTSQTSDVYAYYTSIKPFEGVPIVSRATVYDDLGTNTTYIFIINEALYYGNKLDHYLINPNQVVIKLVIVT